MQTVAETPTFSRQADKLFSEDEKHELINHRLFPSLLPWGLFPPFSPPAFFLAENPLAGDEIPGTGGVRKLRFAPSGRGKRGGARVIYYYLDKARRRDRLNEGRICGIVSGMACSVLCGCFLTS